MDSKVDSVVNSVMGSKVDSKVDSVMDSVVDSTRRNQEGPGGTRRNQEGPGGTRRDQEEPGGTRRNQEGPGGTRRNQEGPGGIRRELLEQQYEQSLNRLGWQRKDTRHHSPSAAPLTSTPVCGGKPQPDPAGPVLVFTMTSSMLRRQLKNLVQNYSEAEVKVREATSNDPWGPSSSQMADLSDLTYNVVACNEIMTMLWKRLKDDRNWRHIYKSLTLLEYLLKTGDDRVLLKMKDNIYIVKALTEFRFMDKDGKDQGTNVREKAKVVLILMEDDEKLKTERDFAVKTREKTSKSAAASSSDTPKDPNYKPCYVAGASGLPSLDNIPSVADLTASFAARKEERLRQEAEKKETERRVRNPTARPDVQPSYRRTSCSGRTPAKPETSKPDAWSQDAPAAVKPDSPDSPEQAGDPWGAPTKPPASADPWGAPAKTEEDPFAAPKTDEDPFSAPDERRGPVHSHKRQTGSV
ncbi:Epsin-1 [Merluccius polli]|uniref:Epsin-1 n=1 Tax=Merluccius polli TaxID=89951 RepID=A0AA47NVR2_MERPO|nr:Epsin-1 [Merluccius polli]